MPEYETELFGLPEYMHGGIKLWIEHGIKPGRFLTAVLENNLKEACAAADDTNRYLLFAYVNFFYNHAPGACWGNPERVQEWHERFFPRERMIPEVQ